MEEVIFKKKTVGVLEFFQKYLEEINENAKLRSTNLVLSESIINLQADKVNLVKLCLNNQL